MAIETETTQRQTTAERAADEDLIARAPAHDGVATQRDLRETERYLQNEIRASEGRLRSDFNAKFDDVDTKFDKVDARFDKMDSAMERMDAKFEAKFNRAIWLIAILLIAIIGGLAGILGTMIALLVRM